ncbi:IclR family transcriptional regulator [Biomaibacter acetigenes]|jgi:DNA-binding IclR family transcriptional regulator|uniref:Glycerol operon regulatory protein n=1 Tax=Biomaibacter acetigenes TaxID=2316383 RepID=A0A3G2R2U2_9FIRM|nr:IclR family transcriptional regulator [Biomaibacter acetigenes]AYO29631.1 IclR family transcriptional regulator [Biomaibacter acetigenes]RKL63606.1 IclR family transcriptional regulator [Thermoanaerobacteraceae bacterium SP2]
MKQDKAIIQSVDRALRILELFREESSLGLTQIAERMDLAKSTVYGLVATLETHHYLEQDPDNGKYRLGIRLLELGELFNQRLDLRREAVPIMRDLVEKYSETVQLSILDGTDVVYIDLIEAPTSIRYTSRIGKRVQAHCAATGKAMLADLPEDVIDKIYSNKTLVTPTPRSISNIVLLKEHLKLIRQQGYSIDDEELDLGVRGAGASIKNKNGRAIAGISLGGPTSRVTHDMVREFGLAVKEAALLISQRLGYQKEK